MYVYEKQREEIFTDEGQRMFLKIRAHVFNALEFAGAVRMNEAISTCTGDSWRMLACVDRMVELGEIREISQTVRHAGQHRIFVKCE
jgi:hypothetical protein